MVFSAVRYLKNLRTLYRIGSDVLNKDLSKNNHSSGGNSRKAKKIEIIRAFLATMEMVQHLALHAAGFYRARYEYCYERKDSLSGLQITNYLKELALLEREKYTELVILLPLLCPRSLLTELSTQILTSSQPTVVNHALQALFYLASSECQELVIKEITGMSGKLMAHLIGLLHHPCDHANRLLTGNLVTAMFVQLCSSHATRKALMLVNIPQYLMPLNQRYLLPTTHHNHRGIDSMEHMRGILVASMLSRQGEWNYVDPEALMYDLNHGHRMYETHFHQPPSGLNSDGQAMNFNVIDEAMQYAWLREEILLTWLRTIKNVNYDGHNHHVTVSDLVIMPTDPYRAVAASRSAGSLCALEIVHTLYHPQEEYYYEKLPLHEAVAVVEIIESFASYAQTAKMIFATELIRFLAKFLYLVKYLFLGKSMHTAQVMVLLNGVKASFVTLGRLCAAIEENKNSVNRMATWVLKTDLIATTLFFLNTLSTFDEKTDPEIIRLQKIVGISSLAFFHKLAHMLNVHYEGKDKEIRDNPYSFSSSSQQAHHRRNPVESKANPGGDTMVMTVEDLFPSGEITVKLFHRLKDIIHTRHEHYTRELVLAEKMRAQYAHQARPVKNMLTSGSVIITSNDIYNNMGNSNNHNNNSALEESLSAEQRYRFINNASPPASPRPMNDSPHQQTHFKSHKHGSVFAAPLVANNNNSAHSPMQRNRPKKVQLHDPYQATTSVTTHLHPRDEFLQVLDAMCKFLMELTMFSPGAYAAVQEWKLFATLKRYLPPPLSGLNDASNAFLRQSMYVETRASVAAGMVLSRNSMSMSRASSMDMQLPNAGNNNKHSSLMLTMGSDSKDGYMLGAGSGSHPGTPTRNKRQSHMSSSSNASIQSNDSAALQAALSTAARLYGANRAMPAPGMGRLIHAEEKDNDSKKHVAVHDDVELIDLPSSYFQLCANLCRISDGTTSCFAEGFLRRACDKAMTLYAHLLAHRDPVKKTIVSSPSFPWEFRRLDFIACLRVITATANYHHPQFGSSNDLIFSTPYDIVLVCKTLITLKLKRTDELVLVAYECLAALAQDTFRVNQILEFHDVYEDIRQELSVLTYHFPARGVLACIRIIHGSTIGLTSPYLAEMIPKLREPLTKAARIYPQLEEAVRNANWTLTKSAMIYRTTFDASYKVEDAINVEIEEFIRTGTRDNIQRYLQQSPLGSGRSTPPTPTPTAPNDAFLTSPVAKKPSTGSSSAVISAAHLILQKSHGNVDNLHPGRLEDRSSLPNIPQTTPFAAPAATAIDSPLVSSSPISKPLQPSLSTNTLLISKQLFPSSSETQLLPIDDTNVLKSSKKHVSIQPPLSHKELVANDIEAELEAKLGPLDNPGQYSHCGISSCGSLRIPASMHIHDHGDVYENDADDGVNATFRGVSATDMDTMVKQLDLSAVYGDEVLPISKLSAREPGLLKLVAERKGRAGFTEVQKTLIYPKDLGSHSGEGRHRPTSSQRKTSGNANKPAMVTLNTQDLPELRRTRPPPPSKSTRDGSDNPNLQTPVKNHLSTEFEPWTTGAKLKSDANLNDQDWVLNSFPSSPAIAGGAPFVKSPDQLIKRKKAI